MAGAFRMARWAEDDEFNSWVAALKGDESAVRGTAIDPETMQVEVPDIPVAGASEEADAVGLSGDG